MDITTKITYLEDRLHNMNRNGLIGAEYYLKDLKRLSDNATSLKDCFDLHRAAVDLGILNRNLDSDTYGVFRCDDIRSIKKEEVFLGGQYGVYTKDMTVFEANRYQRPDAYMQALGQYKNLLSSNFAEMKEKVSAAVTEEEKENGRNVIARLFSPGKYPSRRNMEHLSAVQQNRERFMREYISAGGPGTDPEKFTTILSNEETKHIAVNRLLETMKAAGRTFFGIEKDAFDGWVPAVSVGGTKYIIDSVAAENSTLTFIARAYDGKELSLTVGGDNLSFVTGLLRDKEGHTLSLNQTDALAIRDRLPIFASMTYVNLDWQDQMVENFRQSLPGREDVTTESRIRGYDETRELQDLDKLCSYYTAEHFKMLFPAVRLSDCNEMETKAGEDSYSYGNRTPGDLRFVRTCNHGTSTDLCWRHEMTTGYGTRPYGNELHFDGAGQVSEFRTTLTPQYAQKCFTSDSVYFRPDGGIDRERTLAARGKGDFPVSFTELLENIEYRLQEKQSNQAIVIMKTKKGYIGRDQDGFVLLDKKKNDILNGLRFDMLTKPVNGISVGKVDSSYTLVNVDRGEMVDKVMRPYVGEMTQEGWALIREKKQNGMEAYNYINASGDTMSPKGFEYATEFREGKASVMVGRNLCEINTGGVVTKVEFTDTVTVKENKTVQIKR